LAKPGYSVTVRYGPEVVVAMDFVKKLFGGNQSKGIIESVMEFYRTRAQHELRMDKVKMLLETPAREWSKLLAASSLDDNSKIQVVTMDLNKLSRKYWQEKNLEPKAVEYVSSVTLDDKDEVVTDEEEEVL
jgi:hypothetical protein